MAEDKNITTYIHEYQIVRDKQRKHQYKLMKKGVMNYLQFDESIKNNVHQSNTIAHTVFSKKYATQGRRQSFAGFTSGRKNSASDVFAGYPKKKRLMSLVPPSTAEHNIDKMVYMKTISEL